MKMWDGRFSKPSDELMESFNNSLPVDKALIEEDIAGSIAWAGALEKIGVFSPDERGKVADGLRGILEDYRAGRVEFLKSDEDIHMAVERLLVERVGAAGERLHTGRSRNDQVITDTRLYTKKALFGMIEVLTELQGAAVERAKADIKIIIPGFTHLQQAQPVLLSHYWMSMFSILEREKSRIRHAIKSTDILPLGSGAMAGSGFDVDRDAIARELGFSAVSSNSMDMVSSRDFLLETLSVFASTGIHLSRYAEDLIIWSSKEFGFVELDDAWSTGSSMMPQKKNPDSLELIRGKSGRLIGNYMRLATTVKGLGLTYFKDLQEDKEPLFDSEHNLRMVVKVFTQVLLTVKVREERIRQDLDPFLLATDMADYLVRKGMPFRQAHKVIGRLVGYCVEADAALTDVPVCKLKEFSEIFGDDVKQLYSWEQAVSARTVAGGTSPLSVKMQIAEADRILNDGSGEKDGLKYSRVVEQAGGVLFREVNGELEVLTVRSKKFPDQRIFPKGHIEPGETEEQTAVRELCEEGGMVGEIVGYSGRVREFVFKEKLYRVKYYAMRYLSTDNPGEPNREPQWTSIPKTREILPFDDLREVLDGCVGLMGR
ncbi:MAG: argininosuccinate lyase [Chitinispirillia bacterium]|nr:argininosuccinate lyase [Chitinispirillia bacterium]MCL2241552.1 argininosuccinate lyase [Chitinispirillia bacterium]